VELCSTFASNPNEQCQFRKNRTGFRSTHFLIRRIPAHRWSPNSLGALIDQGNSYHDYVNFDSESGPEKPDSSKASIVGIGHLVAYIGYEKVAELKQNNLVRTALDVFQPGKVREALESGIRSHLDSLRAGWPDEFPADFNDWEPPLVEAWLAALRRLLLRVQNMRHRGAFLMTSDQKQGGTFSKA